MNILYYSKYCRTCSKLFYLLTQQNLFFLFDQIICVDDKIDQLPPFITCVPVIVTPDYDVPLIDNTVFQWIDYKLQIHANKGVSTGSNSCSSGTCKVPNNTKIPTTMIQQPPANYPITTILSSTTNEMANNHHQSENVKENKKHVIMNSYERMLEQRAIDDKSFIQPYHG